MTAHCNHLLQCFVYFVSPSASEQPPWAQTLHISSHNEEDILTGANTSVASNLGDIINSNSF